MRVVREGFCFQSFILRPISAASDVPLRVAVAVEI